MMNSYRHLGLDERRDIYRLVATGEIQAVADRLNSTPRKCLGYRTPHEVRGEQIALLKAG